MAPKAYPKVGEEMAETLGTLTKSFELIDLAGEDAVDKDQAMSVTTVSPGAEIRAGRREWEVRSSSHGGVEFSDGKWMVFRLRENHMSILVLTMPAHHFGPMEFAEFVQRRPGAPSGAETSTRNYEKIDIAWEIVSSACVTDRCRTFVVSTYEACVFGRFDAAMTGVQMIGPSTDLPYLRRELKPRYADGKERNVEEDHPSQAVLGWVDESGHDDGYEADDQREGVKPRESYRDIELEISAYWNEVARVVVEALGVVDDVDEEEMEMEV